MKKILFGLMALSLAFACAKEPVSQDVIDIDTKPAEGDLVTYSFNVSIAPVTKAYIDEADGDDKGKLKWESTDEIAVYNTATNEYVTFATTGTGATATFTADAPAGASFTKAYYPSDYRGESVYDYLEEKYASEAEMSVTNSRKCIPMEIDEISAGATDITFAHKASILKFRFSNLPSFTRKATLWYGTLQEDVQISDTEAASGEVEVFFAVPAYEEINFNINLYDGNDSPGRFFSKSREDQEIELANMYRYSVKLGHVLTFKNEIGWENPNVHVWKVGGTDAEKTTFSVGSSYPWTLYPYPGVNAGTKYYAVLNTSSFAWAAEGTAIGVGYYIDNWDKNSQTPRVYLYRDIDFVIPNNTSSPKEPGLKTDYYVYIKKAESYIKDVCKISAWYGGDTYLDNSAMTWDSQNAVFKKCVSGEDCEYYGNVMHFSINDGAVWTQGDNQWYNQTINQDHMATANRWGDDSSGNLWLTDKY